MKSQETLFRILSTPHGLMAIIARGGALIGVALPHQSRAGLACEIADRWPDATASIRLLPLLCREIRDYFAGRADRFTTKVDLRGCSEFQRRVLAACRRIPPGTCLTYGELARRAGHPGAARAVGRALATNPAPLVIPCHRVIASTGALCGFSAAGGLDLKRRLLDHEKCFAEVCRRKVPRPKA
jgi:methylated-DNA-[protein]-cysteine S-methyltransferase